MVEAIQLSLTDYLDAHQVPAAERPMWIRLLVALERTYRLHALAPLVAKQEAADGES